MGRTFTALALFAALFAAALTHTVGAQVPGPSCRISGRVTSGTTPLPGVAIIARTAQAVITATSTDLDGRYDLAFARQDDASLRAELTGFSPIERALDTAVVCGQSLDLQLSVAPRTATPVARGRAGRGRFETLNVARQGGAPDATPDSDTDTPTQLALPPGFAVEGPTDAVAVNGNVANIDRGALNDRIEALNRGDFLPPPAEGGGGFGLQDGGGFGAGRGGPPGGGAGRAGGPGGRGGFAGRGGGGEPQRVYSFNTGYTLGGSFFDAAPYQLRPEQQPADPDYLRQNADFSVSGPLKIPGIYDGTRRTDFSLNYSSNRGETLFDQYATVPTTAMRGGDFSALSRTLVDPSSGLAFEGNRIPQAQLSPAALYLLQFIPEANLPGTSRNFRYLTATNSATDNLNLRLNHNFTPNAGGRGGRGGGGGGRAGGGGARAGGAGGGAAAATTASMNAQIQFRRNDSERNNVFPSLGGTNTGSTLTVPVNLNVSRRRTQHAFNVNLSRTHSGTRNQYAFVKDVAAEAGITGVATDPFDWGVPALSFSSLSSLNDVTPSERTDTRLTGRYTWSRPMGRHMLRLGGEFRHDVAASRTDSNARGTFVYTGLYSGSDFADFLLGAPQQASVHYGPGDVELRGRAMSVFIQDDWRRTGRLTFNLGLRYELTWPLVEGDGRLINLDVAPDFSAAAPVAAGATGQYSGAFPDALIKTDINNIAPRIGVAWRAAQSMVVRGGYGISYNAGTYSQIARQLASQPPYAVTDTSIGSPTEPLAFENAFAAAAATATTNNFGVDPDYQLGRVQTWNVDASRELTRSWQAGAGYTYAMGSNLDLVRAPNRGPSGLRIEGVEPFLWQTSESSSRLHSANFRLRRRPVRGIGGGVTYTLAQSRDNASSIGGGTVVAQDDQNLEAEWGLSSFNRRHQVRADMRIDLPFGPNRRWLQDAGVWTKLLEMWTMNLTLNVQSGTPLTARVLSSASDAARGTNGTLRADYTGQEIGVDDPTIDQFFNTAAFSLPAAGSFGTAGRNLIIGPGSKELNAQFTRDVSLGDPRTLTIQLRANNLLNLVNYAAIDTTVNSPSFGQVTSVRSMRSMQLTLRVTF